MRVEKDLAAALRRRDLEGLFRVGHREFVGDDDIPHPLHLCVAAGADDAGPVDPARVNGAHDLEVLFRNAPIRVNVQDAIGIAEIFLDVKDAIVTQEFELSVEHLLFACEVSNLVGSDAVREIKYLSCPN